jgi:hypothetical protein
MSEHGRKRSRLEHLRHARRRKCGFRILSVSIVVLLGAMFCFWPAISPTGAYLTAHAVELVSRSPFVLIRSLPRRSLTFDMASMTISGNQTLTWAGRETLTANAQNQTYGSIISVEGASGSRLNVSATFDSLSVPQEIGVWCRGLTRISNPAAVSPYSAWYLFKTPNAHEVEVLQLPEKGDSTILPDSSCLSDSWTLRFATMGRVTIRFRGGLCAGGPETAAVVRVGDKRLYVGPLDSAVVSGLVQNYSVAMPFRNAISIPLDTTDRAELLTQSQGGDGGSYVSLDSGILAINSYLRPQPTTYSLPAALWVTGKMQCRVTGTYDALSAEMKGTFSSITAVLGERTPAGGPILRTGGVQLLPKVTDVLRDKLVGVAALVFFLVTLLGFLKANFFEESDD